MLPTDKQLESLKKVIDIKGNRRVTKFIEENETLKQGLIVLSGDSIIENYHVEEYFDNNVVNRGIAGYTTKDFLEVFDKIVVPLNPSKLFLHIGSNDLVLLHASKEEALINILNTLDYVKTKLPQTKVYYLSLTPVLPLEHKKTRALYVANRTNEELDEMNQILAQKVENFIDINDSLKDGAGVLEEWYTDDGIHLNHYGYVEISSIIKTYI
ncbi:Esterase, SGNH hydrolase-type [Alteracholeplasma palmae J233]|uniref:Esterase, SGNH hydrolase-type n=1 Tax=Alteracholeplasma palmae (strain ATCC 49389 / J233) TaxID=1318466 RepID=U4KQK8_ALTPJ|nr:GDSL-type esterase/lipase family protein [Alteracholeplasma palmae]CCV64755.1 Esterase, SGNH hydrolase-type [Alteracholeplasma palmae J233]